MKFSIIIITRNRKEDLKVTIEGFERLTYKNKEIIVIDNASIDGTREMFQNEYAHIKYLWLPDNFDIRAINIGIEMSDGDIIWRTDSDSNPESEDTFERVAKIFEENPDIDIICTEDIEVRNNYEPWEWYPLKIDKSNIPAKGFKANVFPGTGAAIRRKVYDKIGGFWGFGFEELDFCTRAIVEGFNVRYFPNIRTLHYSSTKDRDNSNRWVMISKQHIRYTWKYFPFFSAVWRTTQILFFQLLIAIINRLPISAFFDGLFGMLSVIFSTYRNERRVVPKNKIQDITLGLNVWHTQLRYFKQIFINQLRRRAKK